MHEIAIGNEEQPDWSAPEIVISRHRRRTCSLVIPLDSHHGIALLRYEEAPLTETRMHFVWLHGIVPLLAHRVGRERAVRQLANLVSRSSRDRDHLPRLHIAARWRPARSIKDLVYRLNGRRFAWYRPGPTPAIGVSETR
jgi:hypothetical protein